MVAVELHTDQAGQADLAVARPYVVPMSSFAAAWA
jgi:hypothetical protein